MIVRELITRLGFTVDQAGFAQAEKSIADLRAQINGQTGDVHAANAEMAKHGDEAEKAGQKSKQAAEGTGLLGQALGMLQRFNAQAGISNLLQQYVTLASDANETGNVLKEVFGDEGKARVEEWSESMGTAMGRSSYDLQAYASRLGSVIGPVAKSQKDAEDMSKALAGLAVDLGSFFNTTDQDAMMALRSGLTGEYESLKRYGVVINDATLQEIAHQKGIKKKVTAMTVAEKTELRYLAIMERTKAAQGDAARTGDGYANASKALDAALKDLGTEMAMTVIPAIEKVIRFARDAVNWFNNMAKNTNILEAAMYSLGAAAVVLGIEFYSAFILPTLALLAIIILVDELVTLFRGGETVLGRFINAMAGDRAAENWVLNMIAGFSILGEEIDSSWEKFQKTWADEGGWAGISNTIFGFWEDFGIRMGDWAAALADALLAPFRGLRTFLESLGVKFAAAPVITPQSYKRAAGRGVDAAAQEGGFNPLHAQRHAERAKGVEAGVVNSNELRLRRYQAARGLAQQVMAERDITGAAGTAANQAGIAAVSGTPTAVTAPPAAGGGAAPAAPSPVIVPVSTAAPTINIYGDDDRKVRRVVAEVLDENRKKQIAAVGRQGGA